MKHIANVIVREEVYEILWQEPDNDNAGECNWDARTIKIDPTIKGLLELDTVIHEFLHAAIPDFGEDAITEIATNLAKMLWRMGYRAKAVRKKV